MDDSVKQAMAKWPNVPHCYGWLALDARGIWRMRDERAQQLNLPGDKLTQPTLLGFINRNYGVDERGCWYFQNGPQRVYLILEATPFIARTDPVEGLVLQTGEALPSLDAAFLSDEGAIVVQSGQKIAQVDDRDVAQLLATLELDGAPVSDEALMAWLAAPEGKLVLPYRGTALAVQPIPSAELAQHFGFVRLPQPE